MHPVAETMTSLLFCDARSAEREGGGFAGALVACDAGRGVSLDGVLVAPPLCVPFAGCVWARCR